MRRLWTLMVSALLISMLGLPVTPACACDCAMLTPQQALEAADTVFIGVATRVDRPLLGTSSADPVEVRFLVERVDKGAPGERVTLVTANASASCGYDFAAGMRYRVFARDGAVSLCSGTALLGAAPEIELDQGLSSALVVSLSLLVVVATGLILWITIRRRRRTLYPRTDGRTSPAP